MVHRWVICTRVMGLRLITMVDCYCEEFEALTAPLKHASEEVLVGAFKNGLRPKIRAELHLFEARSLTEVMGLAQCIEERNFLMSKAQEGPTKLQRPSMGSRWTQHKTNWVKQWGLGDSTRDGSVLGTGESKSKEGKSASSSSPSFVQRKPNPSLKKLTETEVIKRKEHRLFKCDEKSSPGHRSKNRLYQTMALHETE